MPSTVYATDALLPTGWARDVRIALTDDGRIHSVECGVPPGDAERLAGPVVPAMPNLHSHAFQRAMAGLAEASSGRDDSFWTWRDQMYRIVERLAPEDLEAIATAVYVDMLKAGYGAVAEFHYVHHAPDGRAYADRGELAKRILAAARSAGIGLTLLPVFYAHANFGGRPPGEGQRRFIHDVDGFQRLMADLQPASAAAGATLGYAFHSLRAATPDEITALLGALPGSMPVHIHVGEQQKEVDDCLAWCGRRPVRWLLDEVPVNHRWCLVHATHAQRDEIASLAASGAVAGLCPTTEANLGDGIFAGTAFQSLGGRFGIGSDSHVSLSVVEELRWLEYGQRLREQRRTLLAGPASPSVGRTLYDTALAGGAQALGQAIGRISPGMLANLVVLDGSEPLLADAARDSILDRWLFAVGDRAVRDVMVAGRWRIRDGRHDREREIGQAFRSSLRRIAAA